MHCEIKPGVFWNGYIDWNLRDFHGYETERGSTYNSYLVLDEKNTLIDTVKEQYADDLLNTLRELVSLDKISYLVCNHAEPDHSGALPAVLTNLPNATLVCNQKCLDILSSYYDSSSWRVKIITDGEELDTGKRKLQFINTPLVHWPESMFTWCQQEKLLFSMDAFGQHLATSERFDDLVDQGILFQEAKTYYANIIMPFGKQVNAVLQKARRLEPEIICPSHGVIWRTNIKEIVDRYEDWSTGKLEPKVLIIYDSMWGSTEKLAQAIFEGANIPGVDVQLIHVRRSSLARIAAESLEAAVIAIGSSTLNKGMMPMIGAVLTYLQGLLPSEKSGFAFGSSGWGKGGADMVHDALQGMKWDIIREPLKNKFSPDDEVFEECLLAGKLLAERAAASALI